MHHAILASWIAPVAIFFPRRFFDQILEGGVMRIGHQVTGPLPTAWIVGGIPPGRTHHVALTGKERSPDPFTVIHVIGSAEAYKRIKTACDTILSTS